MMNKIQAQIMNIRFLRNVWLPVGIAIALSLTSGCVTETKTGMERNADPQKSLQANVDLGLGYMQRGDLARAKEKLDKANSIDSNSAVVHNAFGLLFQVEGDDENAERHFQRSIRIDPHFALAHNNYGAFLYAKGRYGEAIEQLKEATADPFYRARAQVFENLAMCYLKVGNNAEAIGAFKRAISVNPNQAKSLLELAELSYDQPDYVAARDLYSRYVKVAEQNAKSLWLGIRIARVFRDKDEEASYVLMLKNIFPTSEEYRMYQDLVR